MTQRARFRTSETGLFALPSVREPSGTSERSPNPLPGSTPHPRLAPNVRRSPDLVTSLRARLRPAIRDRNTMRPTNWMPRCPARWTGVRDFSRRGTPHLHVRSRPCARDPDSRPPLRPATRASSDVHSWAVPFACAARPPLLAISFWRFASIDANPLLLFPDPDIRASIKLGSCHLAPQIPNGRYLRGPCTTQSTRTNTPGRRNSWAAALIVKRDFGPMSDPTVRFTPDPNACAARRPNPRAPPRSSANHVAIRPPDPARIGYRGASRDISWYHNSSA